MDRPQTDNKNTQKNATNEIPRASGGCKRYLIGKCQIPQIGAMTMLAWKPVRFACRRGRRKPLQPSSSQSDTTAMLVNNHFAHGHIAAVPKDVPASKLLSNEPASRTAKGKRTANT